MNAIRKWDKDGVLILGLAFILILGGLSMLFVSDKALVRNNAVINYVLLGGLFLVTAFYAIKTREIAKATESLARETVEQRYTGFLPIIDILEKPSSIDLIRMGATRP